MNAKNKNNLKVEHEKLILARVKGLEKRLIGQINNLKQEIMNSFNSIDKVIKYQNIRWRKIDNCKPKRMNLPEEGQTVLLSDGVSVCTGYWYLEKGDCLAELEPLEKGYFLAWYVDADGLNEDHLGWSQPTHWAFLPKPPKD